MSKRQRRRVSQRRSKHVEWSKRRIVLGAAVPAALAVAAAPAAAAPVMPGNAIPAPALSAPAPAVSGS